MNWAEICAIKRREEILFWNGSIIQTQIILLFFKNNWKEENIKAWRKEEDREEWKAEPGCLGHSNESPWQLGWIVSCSNEILTPATL